MNFEMATIMFFNPPTLALPLEGGGNISVAQRNYPLPLDGGGLGWG